VSGIASFEITAFHCLGAAVLFTPMAIGTGLYTWWLNYLAKPIKAIKIKRILSPLVWLLALIAFVWRLMVPDILKDFGAVSMIYLLIILAFVPLVTVIGWFGAQLTFPVEKE
jgi:uncharacterized membrane protein